MSRALFLVGLIAVVAACSGGPSASVAPTGSPAGSGAPGSPTPAASEAPSTGEIEHATGATDVILRYEEGGGFMMPAFAATMAPHFTLYGDGTIVFRNPMQEPPPAIGPVFRSNPFRTARMDEQQIQELLQFALVEGGLATAKVQYDNPMVADAGTAIFTIRAGELEKTVNVYALGLPMDGVPDQAARAQFTKLAERLGNVDQNGTFASDVYVPTAYRAILIDTGGFPGESPVAWPWDDISPADFKADEAAGLPFPTRVMTPEELEVFGIEDFEGGFQGMTLIDPAGGTKSYTLGVRPLLPDEER